MSLYRRSDYNIYLAGKDSVIIWNTLTGYIDGIKNDHSLYKVYMDGKEEKWIATGKLFENEKESSDVIRHAANGLLTSATSKNEREQASEKNFKVRKDSKTLGIVLTSTLGCNFGCSYCCQGTEKDFSSFNPEIIKKITDIYISRNYQNLEMIWYGGEPLLVREKIKEASTKLKVLVKDRDGKYESTLITNGSLLNLNTATALRAAGIKNFHISIDGCKKYHDQSRNLKGGGETYQTIIDNVNGIEDSDLDVKVCIRVNHYTKANNIKETIDDFLMNKANNWKKTRIYLARIEQRIGTDQSAGIQTDLRQFGDDFQEFSHLCRIKKIPITYQKFNHGLCSATDQHSIVLSPSGDIHKCWDTVADKDCNYGSILTDREIEILGSNTTKWTNFNASENDYCSNCKLLPVCGGSCAIKHFEGLSYDSNYHTACPSTKHVISEIIVDRAKQIPRMRNYLIDNVEKIPLKSLAINQFNST